MFLGASFGIFSSVLVVCALTECSERSIDIGQFNSK